MRRGPFTVYLQVFSEVTFHFSVIFALYGPVIYIIEILS